MKTLPIDDHNQDIFSHKLGTFFPIFEKGQGRTPPLPPSSYAAEVLIFYPQLSYSKLQFGSLAVEKLYSTNISYRVVFIIDPKATRILITKFQPRNSRLDEICMSEL